jgi:dienelactone hydrolase
MASSTAHGGLHEAVQIETRRGAIAGALDLPDHALGVVVFAHGSGSSRHSPRNRSVAESLHAQCLGTLLIDLLTSREERVDAVTAEHRFNIPLLAERLAIAAEWLADLPEAEGLPIGYFGASTGAAAALAAAARQPLVSAVVSRGGRPDLAAEALREVRAATLLIVGGRDRQVLQLNRTALVQLRQSAEKELVVVPGATHLFEEPGALEEVARLAGKWFVRHFEQDAAGPARSP